MSTVATAPPEHSASATTELAPAIRGLGGHIPALDGLRGLAALMVMTFHFRFPDVSDGVSYTLWRAFSVGQSGVDLFFVLSGFLITGILLESKGSPRFLRNFYMRRLLRIFPLYYLILLQCFLLSPLLGWSQWDFRSFGIYALYLQSLPGVESNGPGHFWSLGVEEHFYMFWPMLVLFLDRRKLIGALLLIIAGVTCIRTWMIYAGISEFTLTPARLDAISLGSLLAVLARDPVHWARAVRAAKWAAPAIIGGALALFLLFGGQHMVAIRTVKYSLWAGSYAILLLWVVSAPPQALVSRFMCTRVMRTAGKYSYGLYVYHPALYLMVDDKMRPLLQGATGYKKAALVVLAFIACFAAAWVAAFASYQLYEKHFLKLKRFFERKPAGARVSAKVA